MALIDEIRAHGSVATAVYGDKQRAEILAECHLILSHPSFKNSKRCVTLFQFLIERALAGDHENLKERTLGVEVFGRNPDYDTNADPIVRMTASEIRKRLAQYYQQGEHPRRVRIQLVPGSYVPQFEFVAKEIPAARVVRGSAEKDDEDARTNPELDVAPPVAARKKSARWMLVSGLILGALAMVLVGRSVLVSRDVSTQELIWAPILHENGRVMINVTDGAAVAEDDVGPDWATNVTRVIATSKFRPSSIKNGLVPQVAVVDAEVAARAMAFLAVHHHDTAMRDTSATALDDLRQGPAVIVGAYNNPWFLVLFSGLRFHVMVDPSTQDEWIEDTQNPSRREWVGSGHIPFRDSKVDYALLSRVRSHDTGTWILGIGGLGLHGTEAAGELVTNPNFSRLLPDSLRDPQKNFQIVIKTVVINGKNGPPQIVASYVW